MATSALSNTILDPSGSPVAGARVVARLLPTPGFRTSGGSEVAGQVETDTNASGAWSLTLERNADITPENTFYEITEYVPVGGRTYRRVWTVSVPSSSATLLDALITPPQDNPPYTIVSGGESGGLGIHEAATTDVHGIADTSDLATDAAVATAVSDHSSGTTSVHGIPDTAVLATATTLATAVSDHSTDTSTHGVANMAALIPAANAVTTGTITDVGTTVFVAEADQLTSKALAFAVAGDENPRIVIRGDGFIEFGRGAALDGASIFYEPTLDNRLTLYCPQGFYFDGGDIIAAYGVVLYSPDSTPYRIIVANGGALSTEAVV
jgi:hypothetical protein